MGNKENAKAIENKIINQFDQSGDGQLIKQLGVPVCVDDKSRVVDCSNCWRKCPFNCNR